MKNYSRQREAILQTLRSTDSHPTANWIYQKVKEEIPNISLGTVYRNLAALAENGDILSINVGDGYEHFDADINPHAHLHCKCCKGIADLRLSEDVIRSSAKSLGFEVENTVYVAYGLCEECQIKN